MMGKMADQRKRRPQKSGPRPSLLLVPLLAAAVLAAAGAANPRAACRSRDPDAHPVPGRSVPDEAAAIRQVLDDQARDWNRGSLDGFLEGYWKSEATAFAGTQGILRGWNALEARYRRSYPDRRAMGSLTFSDLEITLLCSDAALVLGHWHLEREGGPLGGVFSLVLRRFPEGWRIIADHTSSVATPAGVPGQ